jgi:membrane protease YdiL (CAAX protease family)
MVVQKVFLAIRPVVLSALLLFVTANTAQNLITLFIPSFDILASKDLGKIVFTTLVFISLGFFVWLQSASFRFAWIKRNFGFLGNRAELTRFAQFFTLFFTLHALFLGICFALGFAHLQPAHITNFYKLAGQLLFGFCATFMLAYTEEVMFRGTLFPYFSQWLRPITAAFVTSLAFMIVHFLPNPLAQLLNDCPTGLGLFSLGFMLNLIFIKMGTMYANIGTHAGLVFVKVVLRKIRFLVFAPIATLPWLLHSDLRQAPLVHILFWCISVGLVVNLRKIIFAPPQKK